MAAAAASTACPPFSWPSPPPPCSVDDALGPLSLSNWVLPGSLCVGGYPSAMSNEKAMTYAQAIVDSGLDTIVNLMQSNELSRFREYAGLMTHLAKPRPVQFLSFPIGDGSCPKDQNSFLALVDDLIKRLQSGRKLYIHCWGGHGRTGTVLSVILGAIYPSRSADDCLSLCQELHTARGYNGMHRSPEESQKGFVRSAIERVRQIQAGTESWPPPALQGWTVANLAFSEYSPSQDNASESTSSSSKQTKRQRIQAGLPPTTPPRAGGGSGIIVVDSFGTASTTQAMSSVPSTPLMSPAVRRISAEGLKLTRENSNGNANSTLLPRQMISIENEHAASSSSAASSLPPPFTLLTMNTLADSLCDTKSFPHTVPAALEWSTRCELIIDEITAANRSSLHAPAPDVVCLQEVDHFSDFFSPRLKDLGYGAGYFLGKADKTATSGDGVAIFVRPDAFQVRRIQRLSMPGMNQVALIVQLAPVGESKEQARRLYVVTTHLKAKDGFEIVRLKQVQIILHAVESFIARFHDESLSESMPAEDAAPIDISSLSNPPHASLGADFVLPSSAALIFAGDFNDVPYSPMFNFIAQGSSAIDTTHGVKKHTPAPAASSSAVDSAAMTDDVQAPPAARSAASASVLGLLSAGSAAAPATASSAASAAASSSSSAVCPVRHSLWLHSLYNRFFDPAHPANHDGELYTTAKRRAILVQRCIDYIWFSCATIRPTRMLSIPKVRDEIPLFLPDPRYPSDHLAIAGRFEWSKG